MSKSWPKVKLVEVLRHNTEYISVPEPRMYPKLSVKLYGRGVVLDAPADGTSLRMKRHQLAKGGQVILSEIWGKKGAVGIVPLEGDGALCTSHFFLFDVDESRIHPGILRHLLAGNLLEDQLSDYAKGTTGYAAVRPKQFLNCEIPLPALDEQKRIVAYLDTLSTKITQARTLRHQSTQQAAVFYAQVRDQMFSELRAERKAVGEVFDLVNGRAFKPEEWQDVGRKIIRIQNLKYATVPFNRYAGRVDDKHLVHCGDVLFAWSGQVVSLGAHIWRDDEAILNQHIFNVRARTRMLPEFVREGLNALVDDMKTQVRGLEMFHIRKQELVRLQFPVPALPEQRRIVAKLDALQAKVDALKQLQADTEAELTALQSAALDRAFKGEL